MCVVEKECAGVGWLAMVVVVVVGWNERADDGGREDNISQAD